MNRRISIQSCLAAAGALMLSCAAGAGSSPSGTPGFTAGSRLLFIGDSITDMNRDKRVDPWDQNHVLGHSYVFLLAGRLGVDMPEAQLKFYNRGISGNKVSDLRKRWQTDAIEMNPDILTILIGTNDVGIGFRKPEKRVTPEAFEADYRFILDASRTANPELRLVMMDPFVLPAGNLENEKIYRERRAQTDAMRQVVARLAKEFDAVHIPLQDVFDAAAEAVTPEHWLWDGIHPLPQGHELIAREWLQAVSKNWPSGAK